LEQQLALLWETLLLVLKLELMWEPLLEVQS
jgi:hypothetical protein